MSPNRIEFTLVTKNGGRESSKLVSEQRQFPVNASLRHAIQKAGLAVDSVAATGMVHGVSGGRRIARGAARY